MDAATHRAAKAESRKLVSRVANIEPQPDIFKENRSADSSVVPMAEGYQRWALTYDDDPNPLLAREERHLLPLLAALHGKRILDLACGTGRWLEKLTGLGAGAGI